jgi:putative transposase
VICRLFPQDKTKNASALRRSLAPIAPGTLDPPPSEDLPPLLAKILDQQAASGLPPAYLPKDEQDQGDER